MEAMGKKGKWKVRDKLMKVLGINDRPTDRDIDDSESIATSIAEARHNAENVSERGFPSTKVLQYSSGRKSQIEIPNGNTSSNSSALNQGENFQLQADYRQQERISGSSFRPAARASNSSGQAGHFSGNSVINEHRDEKMVRLIQKLSSNDSSEQAKAAEALFNMTHKDTLDRQKLYAYGAIEPLIHMLGSASEQAVLYSAFIISSLSSIEQSKQELLELSVIPALLSVLSNPVAVACKRGAIRALARLSRSEAMAQEIVACGGLAPLKEILSGDDPYTTKRALLTLYFIGADKKHLQQKIAEAGIIPQILDLCGNSPHEVQMEAVDVIKVLCRSAECGKVIVGANGLAILEDVATREDSPHSKSRARKCLQRLAELHELKAEVLNTVNEQVLSDGSQNEDFKNLVEILRKGDPNVKQEAIKDLAEVAEGDGPTQQDLLQTGAMRYLSQMILDNQATQVGRDIIVRTIANIAQNRENCQKLYECNAVLALLNIIPYLDGPVLDEAARAFPSLAKHHLCAPQMVKSGGVPVLLEILDRGDLIAQQNAIEALHFIRGESKEAELQVIRTVNGISILINQIWHNSSPMIKLHSASILQSLIKYSECLDQLLSYGGYQAMLAQIQRNDNPEYCSLLEECVTKIANRRMGLAEILSEERALQDRVAGLINQLEEATGELLDSHIEEGYRMIPREAFVGVSGRADAYNNIEILHSKVGIQMVPPSIEVRILEALQVAPGHQVLDIGFGTGYLSTLLAYFSQTPGAVTAVEADPEVYNYGKRHSLHVLQARQLSHVPPPMFMQGNVLNLLNKLATYDRVHIGAQVPLYLLPRLTNLCNQYEGRVVVPVDGYLLLIRYEDGEEIVEKLCPLQVQPLIIDSVSPMGTPSSMKQQGGAPSNRGGTPNGQSLANEGEPYFQVHRSNSKQNLNMGGSREASPSATPRPPSRKPSQDIGFKHAEGTMRRTPSNSSINQRPPSPFAGNQNAQPAGSRAGSGNRRSSSASKSPIANGQQAVRQPGSSPNSYRNNHGQQGSQGRAPTPQHQHRKDDSQAGPGGTPTGQRVANPPARGATPTAGKVGQRAASPSQQKVAGDDQGQGAASSAVPYSYYDSAAQYTRLTMEDIKFCRTQDGKKCRLGEGGFGMVYKAIMNSVDEVAVKVVKTDRPSEKEMEQFDQEVRVLASLHHRNIVQFYGACLQVPHFFFVTELMKGGDLYSALRHHKDTMRWDVLGKKVALDVALGINYLHTRKPPMMHRDLKSPNVLLSEEGVAKIADVGMVRRQNKELMTAQPVMTPLWASPEVTRHERASIKADIWSYGILIWEIVSGEDITEYTPLAISKAALGGAKAGSKPTGKIMKLPPKCPPIAAQIFEMCTEMQPSKRPTAADIAQLLRNSERRGR